jgi:hypothetical protein
MPGWFALAGAAVGAVGSVVASGTQADAQQKAADTQRQMFDKINAQEQPFMQAGYGATSRLNELLGLSGGKNGDQTISGDPNAADFGYLTKQFSPADFLANKDPGYDFQLKTGAQAVRNVDTPGVGSLSSSALKNLIGFNQNMAATGYQNAFNRFTTQQNNIFGRLSGIAGLGQNAASNTGVAGTSLGTGIAQAQAAAGASTAAGIQSAGSALGGGANTLAAMMYLNQQQQQQGGSTGAGGP